MDCTICTVHHALFDFFKYFHAVRTGKSHGKKVSITKVQPVGSWIYLQKQRPCHNDKSQIILEITCAYLDDEKSKTRIICKTIP